MKTKDLPIYAKAARVMRLAGVCRQTLVNWARSGHIKTHKVGGSRLFDVQSVLEFVANGPAKLKPPPKEPKRITVADKVNLDLVKRAVRRLSV